MDRCLRLLAGLGLAAAGAACDRGAPVASTATPSARASAPAPPPVPVRVELLASVERIETGSPFWIGAHFQVDPGWHIYWENPGESGLKTRLDLRVPAGFTAGPVRYPGPERFDGLGAVSYGYERETMLLAEVRPPADAAPGAPARFAADASWLACKDVCIPGKATLTLELPAGATSPSAAGASGSAGAPPAPPIAEWVARLPRPLGELPGTTLGRAGSPREPVLVLAVPGASKLAFFPAASPSLVLAGTRENDAGGTKVLRLAFRTLEGAADPGAPGGVLEVTRDGQVSSYSIELAAAPAARD